jgi:hypothetical protein
MTTNTDLERENARNKTTGEFGTHTHTAPEATFPAPTPAEARIAVLEEQINKTAGDLFRLKRREESLAVDVISARAHNAGFWGVPHTLNLTFNGGDGWDAEGCFYAESIVDKDGVLLWDSFYEGQRSFGDDIYNSVRLLGAFGEKSLRLPYDSDAPYEDPRYGIQLNPEAKD